MKSRKPSRADKLGFVLGISAERARTLIAADGPASLEELTALSSLDRATLEQLLAHPAAVDQLRLDPNDLTAAQIRAMPGLKPELVAQVLSGRPYYSLQELQAAVALPPGLLDQLFAAPTFRLADKPAGRSIALEPVFGKYIIPAAPLGGGDALEGVDFAETLAATSGLGWRVVEATDFEQRESVLALKRELAGDVHPILRDEQGFERYLVPGSLDVWFRDDIPDERRLAILHALGLVVQQSRPAVGYYRAALATPPADHNLTRAVLAVVEQANQRSEVRFAEPDQFGYEAAAPDHPVAPDDLEAYATEDLFWHHQAIELAAAHTITTGSDKVTIIVVDSGMRLDHPDLQACLRPGWEQLDLNFDLNAPIEALSPAAQVINHGTMVAGVAGGRGDAALAQARGVAPGCWILPVKISAGMGGLAAPGYGLRAAAICAALSYLRPGERAVLNLSWQTNGEHIGIREALREAQRKGVAIVTSAGNYHAGEAQREDALHYPSAHAYLEPPICGLCSVAALGPGDRRASYSYFGSKSITVSAPGGESLDAGSGIFTCSTPEPYTFTAGTSFAAPHVAGLIALLFSLSPDLAAEEAVRIICETADPIDQQNPLYAQKLGAGRINARAALERLRGAPVGPARPAAHYNQQGQLNINLATPEELVLLPIVGAWRAARLIDYRERHGPFASIWGLLLTGAFDGWAVSQIAPQITVG